MTAYNPREGDTKSPLHTPIPTPDELLVLLEEAIEHRNREDAIKQRRHEDALRQRRPDFEGLALDIRGEILKTLANLFEPGSLVEIRAFNGKGWTVSGYYDDHDALAEQAAELDRQGWQVYHTLNPVNSALLARAANRLVERPRSTTSDNDIIRRKWLLVDVDPARPSGVSATNKEKRAAFERTKEILAHLQRQGWPEPVIADSGNGFHLLYPIDLANDQESRELIKGVLEALAFIFDDEQVKIDTSVHNASRIVRLYGTMTRKGDNTPKRPHRRSKIKTPKKGV